MTFSIYRKLGAPVFSLKKERNKTRIFLPLLMFLTHRAKLLIRGKKSNLQHLTILLVNTWWNVILGRVCFGLSCLCLACLIWLTYTLAQLTNKNTMKITKIQYLLKNLRKTHLFPCYYFFSFCSLTSSSFCIWYCYCHDCRCCFCCCLRRYEWRW